MISEYDALIHLASNEELYKRVGMNIYEAQRDYIENKIYEIFNPIKWLATNIGQILKDERCVCMYNEYKIPNGIIFDGEGITKQSKINKENVIKTMLKLTYDEGKCKNTNFRWKEYYSIYHEYVEHFYWYIKEKDESIEDKTCKFYICYGHHRKIELGYVNILEYIATYTEHINSYPESENANKDYFTNLKKITFNPYHYVASNINDETVKKFINCRNELESERATKHYIRNGHEKKMSTNGFKIWEYLANNPKRIRKILRNEKNKIEYDVLKINTTNVCKEYIKKHKKSKVNKFNPVKFVKEYVDDETVNKNKELNIENAAEYFVKYYILYEKIRYNMSYWKKMSIFVSQRIEDSIRQIPINATKYIIEADMI